MQLKELELYSRFRGLQPGFKVIFTRSPQPVNKVNPFCLVGLNGSGKSNLMQVLAEIFYYLELYVLPDAGNYFNAVASYGFRISYRLPVTPRNFLEGVDESGYLSSLTWRNVSVIKKENTKPVFEYQYEGKEPVIAAKDIVSKLLPNQVIGYSSGMNELISVPFLKMDFYYLDMMRRKMAENNRQDTDEGNVSYQNNPPARHSMTVNRLFYLDYHSNAMMLLANFLGTENWPRKRTELDIINEIVGIKELVSFRVAVNFTVKNEVDIPMLVKAIADNRKGVMTPELSFTYLLKEVEIPPEINGTINSLMDCSTALKVITEADVLHEESSKRLRVEMYFKVDEEMKRAFRDKIRGGAMQLFQQLYLLNLLNIDNYGKEIQEEIKNANAAGSNVKSLMTPVADEDKVFHVDNIRLKKKSGTTIYYSQLSDGEHQYMQIAGALKLINEDAALFLMDEPETHFNPEWRSTLFSTLNNILKRRMENDPDAFIPEQEIVVTSHSPFIVSDCQPEQVYIFERDAATGNVKEPRHPDFNTYGASVNQITAKVFGKKETIAGLAKDEMKKIKAEVEAGGKTKEKAMEEINQLGDSVEKIMLLDEISKMK
jgi:restriction system-associated AAA family ATPase